MQRDGIQYCLRHSFNGCHDSRKVWSVSIASLELSKMFVQLFVELDLLKLFLNLVYFW